MIFNFSPIILYFILELVDIHGIYKMVTWIKRSWSIRLNISININIKIINKMEENEPNTIWTGSLLCGL